MQIKIKRPVSDAKCSSLILWDFTAICRYFSGRHIISNGLNLAGTYWHGLLCIRWTIAPSGGDWQEGLVNSRKGLDTLKRINCSV